MHLMIMELQHHVLYTKKQIYLYYIVGKSTTRYSLMTGLNFQKHGLNFKGTKDHEFLN